MRRLRAVEAALYTSNPGWQTHAQLLHPDGGTSVKSRDIGGS
jgi:hypothetical protein